MITRSSQRRSRRHRLVPGLALAACLSSNAVQASGPVFFVPITVQGNIFSSEANPDFILEDTNGEDWAIEADEPVANAFSISHSGFVIHPFVIEDGAAENTLYIENGDRIGLGTASPVADLTIADPNGGGEASIRFIETIGTDQTWDILASSSRWAVKDVTDNRTRLSISPNFGSELHLGHFFADLIKGPTKLSVSDSGITLTGSLVQLSARSAKTDIEPVRPGDVLDRVLALPIASWRYRTEEEGVRHLGPMAEDFHGIFQLGADDKGLPLLDTSGVALAAIQGLKADQDARIAELIADRDAETAALRREIAELRRLVAARSKAGTR